MLRRTINKINQIHRDMKMKAISKECNSLEKNGKTILFAYCFLVYDRCKYHDFLLAQSLKKRGCKIVPLICGGVQDRECSVYGGAWGNKSEDETLKIKQHKQNCAKCIRCDKQVWKTWSGYDCILAKDEIEDKEKNDIREYVEQLDIQNYKEWTYKGYPIGRWAWLTYCDMYLVSKVSVIDEHFVKNFKSFAINVIMMVISTEKVCDRVKPDIIYSNDSFYYPFCIAEYIALERNIPFYNAYGLNKDTYSYAYNVSTIKAELSDAWEGYKNYELTDQEYKFICNYVKGRKSGQAMTINTADPRAIIKDVKADAIIGKIDKKKKTTLLATNVSWDAAALGKEIQFESMQDWVMETVCFFEKHSEWQLIVRSHPAEKADIIPETKEQVVPMILQYYSNNLPNNIILIPADADISSYDLFDDISVGLVYTSTIGLEMVSAGIPVMTSGSSPYYNKGFTYDTNTKEEYFQILSYLMTYDVEKDKIEEYRMQALKFFYLYHFKYMIPNYWFSHTYGKQGVKLKIKSGKELFPSHNPVLDYICDSIIEGKPIISKDRMIPYNVV